MGLKKFEDFEVHLAEEDKNALANDSVGAKKNLLKSFEKFKDGQIKAYDNGNDTITISVGNTNFNNGENDIIVKVIGFDVK